MKDNESLLNILNTLKDYIPYSLISKECINKILKLSKFFPSNISSNLIFESVINSSKKEADFSFNITVNKIDTFFKMYENGNIIFQNEYWENLYFLCDHWKNNIPGKINHLWIEFDKEVYEKKRPVPLFFLDINENLSGNIQKYSDYQWCIKAIEILKGRPISPRNIENLSYCFDKLSESEKITDIGFLASRNPEMLRVCIKIYNKEKIIDFLYNLGINDNEIENINSCIKPFFSYTDSFLLHLNINQKLDNRIGIDLNISDRTKLVNQERWIEVINILEKNKLCITQKKETLLSWPGRSREIANSKLYKHLTKRYINCFKFVFERKLSVIAKAYFGFIFQDY